VFAQSGDVRLYWESAGSGEPVLLVMGLGMASTGWWRTIPVLAEGVRVLSFDNRGAGRSDRPHAPYTLAGMRDDAIAVLDAAKVDSAAVYGISMGGMIAQELAISQPERVRALVLGASTPGGNRHTLPDDEVLDFVRRRPGMPHEEGVWASVPYNYGRTTRERHADRIAEDVKQRLRFAPDPDGYRAQMEAARWHDTSERLGSVSAPTLVLHGTEDRLVPIANGRLLADGIPGARFEVLKGAAHLYTTDAPEADRKVLRFLLGQTSSTASAIRAK
jgi:pimeloyl-ACP methyl ester carboxylesterase